MKSALECNPQRCVSRKLIQEKALDMANKKGLTDFKASMTWVQKFMDRNGFTIRRKTTQSQRLPPELSKKVSNFFFYLRKYYSGLSNKRTASIKRTG